MSGSESATLTRLRDDVRGSVVLAGDPGYDDARAPWNLAVDQHPIAVATPADVADVQAILRAARDGGLQVTTQPNGHGASDDLAGVVMIRPSGFDEISIDREAQRVRLGAGVNWGPALARLDGTGLIALAGSNPAVNAVALALNGGQSMFSRRHGLTARSVVAVELVDASGAFRRVDDVEDADLMWALRGGGGHFGVVTAIELALYPGELLFGGSLAFDASSAADVLAAGSALASDAPELGLDVGMMRFPDLPFVPPPLRGRTVATAALVHVGDEASGRALAERLRDVAEPIADALTPFTIGSLAAVAGEPTAPMAGADAGGAIARLDAAFARDFVDAFHAGAEHGLARSSVRMLGGAIAEQLGAEFAAVGAPQADGLLACGVPLVDAAVDADAALGPVETLLRAHDGERGVPSFLGRGTTMLDAYPMEVVERLAEVKRRVDPDGIIRANRPLGIG